MEQAKPMGKVSQGWGPRSLGAWWQKLEPELRTLAGHQFFNSEENKNIYLSQECQKNEVTFVNQSTYSKSISVLLIKKELRPEFGMRVKTSAANVWFI